MLQETRYPTARSINLSTPDFLHSIGTEEGGRSHDLDNIVRDYLLPQVVPAFDTVSDQRWTIDFEDLKQTAPELAAAWGANPLPPKGTRSGVTRYEVWRLPPSSESGPGFVSAALVADMDGKGGLMEQMDDLVEEWSTMLSRKRL